MVTTNAGTHRSSVGELTVYCQEILWELWERLPFVKDKVEETPF